VVYKRRKATNFDNCADYRRWTFVSDELGSQTKILGFLAYHFDGADQESSEEDEEGRVGDEEGEQESGAGCEEEDSPTRNVRRKLGE